MLVVLAVGLLVHQVWRREHASIAAAPFVVSPSESSATDLQLAPFGVPQAASLDRPGLEHRGTPLVAQPLLVYSIASLTPPPANLSVTPPPTTGPFRIASYSSPGEFGANATESELVEAAEIVLTPPSNSLQRAGPLADNFPPNGGIAQRPRTTGISPWISESRAQDIPSASESKGRAEPRPPHSREVLPGSSRSATEAVASPRLYPEQSSAADQLSNAVLPKPENPASSLRRDVLVESARNAVALQDLELASQRFENLLIEFPAFEEARSEYVGILSQRGLWADAQVQLEQLLEMHPSEVAYYSRYADLLIQQGKFVSAEGTLKRMLEEQPGEPEAYIVLGRLLVWQGKTAEAAKLYDTHLKSAGNLPPALEAKLARFLMEINRPQQAIAIISRLLEMQSDDPELTLDLLLAHARLGHEALVFDLLGTIAEYPGVQPSQRIALADTLYREAYYRPALMLFEQALAHSPGDINTQCKLIRTHVRLYNMPAAAATLAGLAERQTDVLVRLELANYKTAVGELAEAYAIYQSLLLENPQQVEALKGLGTLLHAISDFRRAETVYRRALENAPNDPQLKQQLAETLLKQRRLNSAIDVLDSSVGAANAVGVVASDPGAIADMLVRGQEYSAAEALCLEELHVVHSASTRLSLRTSLGWAQFRLGRPSEALETFNQTRLENATNSPRLRYGIYCCQRELGQSAAAEAELSEELSLFYPSTYNRVVLADLALQDCNCALAARLLGQALAFEPDNHYLLIRLGEAEAMCDACANQCEDEAHFEQALALSPSNTRARLGLARGAARGHAYASSIELYRQILVALPMYPLAAMEQARVWYAWKGVDRANQAYWQAEEVLQSQPRFTQDANLNARNLQALEDDNAQANRSLQAVVEERSGKYWKNWKPRSSLCHFRNLIEIDPTNEEAYFDLAQVLSELGMTHQAIDQYNQLLAINPCHREAAIARRRKQLELRPQLRNRFEFEHRTGRDGLSSITSLRLESLAVMPVGDQQDYLTIGYAHRFLRPHRGTDADGNVAILGIHSQPLEQLTLFAVTEVEEYDYGFSTRPTFRTGAYWRTSADVLLGIDGFLDNVAENGESIRQDIYRGGFDLSLATYLNWRWQVDGRYRYAAYSDHNSLHELSIHNNYSLAVGRRPLTAKLDFNLLSYANATEFGPTPGVLQDTIHPYFSPSGYVFLTAGMEKRFWLSQHTFDGANQHWFSMCGGARVDSESVGFGLFELRGHRDIRDWLSADVSTAGIFSSVYESVGVQGFLTIRMP
ncbi:tetratricopeptide repeat protein [Aureliella helgolandensis]|uniref:tetratricopeptide repeat protein n=1 Tax=Aureliella helgolandensis TaxID=2527968 RepID=UPI0011A076D9|nr:tetratricopeptide repeat protein [Aureliella helgolandensis]